MRSQGWALIQYDWYPYKKETWRQTHIGRTLCEDEGRVWGDASRSQGMPEIASTLRGAVGEAWNFLTALKKSPCQHLDVGLLAPELCYSGPSKLMHLECCYLLTERIGLSSRRREREQRERTNIS